MGCAERSVRCLVTGLALALAGTVMAQTPPGSAAGGPTARLPGGSEAPLPVRQWTPAQVQQAFERADLDGDGQLSRAEAQHLQLLPRSFEDLDANKDGFVSRDEYLAGVR